MSPIDPSSCLPSQCVEVPRVCLKLDRKTVLTLTPHKPPGKGLNATIRDCFATPRSGSSSRQLSKGPG